MSNKSETFSQIIIRVARRHGIHQVFSDFLEMVVCALSAGEQEERYLEIVRGYEKLEAYDLSQAFGELVIEMDNNGEGLKDCFGDLFMEHLSFGKNGQFFTPQPICDMMAKITNPNGFGERVADCCCGSGRMLLAAAKINRNCLFYGADNDRNCALMCVINLCLNGLLGEVAHMNSLSNKYYGGWQISLHPEHGMPYVRLISEDESYIHLKLPEQIQKIETDHPDIAIPVSKSEIIPTQQVLFEF